MSAQDFINNYTYRKGVTFIDGWRYIADTGRGDCNDFATTVLVLTEGGWLRAIWSLITFQAVFWLVHSPSNRLLPRHVILWHRHYGWIDSTNREWRDTPAPHTRIMPLLFPWSLLRMLWGAAVKLVFK